MAYKCVLLLLVCCMAVAIINADQSQSADKLKLHRPVQLRKPRSPEGGSAGIEYSQDGSGKSATVHVDKNIYTSDDGRLKVDAYGQAHRDFDRNRNDYGGGVRGSWSFGRK